MLVYNSFEISYHYRIILQEFRGLDTFFLSINSYFHNTLSTKELYLTLL